MARKNRRNRTNQKDSKLECPQTSESGLSEMVNTTTAEGKLEATKILQPDHNSKPPKDGDPKLSFDQHLSDIVCVGPNF